MPRPLIIEDNADGLTGGAWASKQAVTIFGGAALLGAIVLFAAAMKRSEFTPESAVTAVGLRLLIFVVPVLGAVAVASDPVRYRVRPGEVVAERWNYLREFGRSWWVFAPLLPGIGLAMYVWVHKVALEPLPVGAPVPWWWTLGTYLLVLGLAVFCAGVLVSKLETRFDDEGVRCGLQRFLEWENVGKVLVRPGEIQLFLRGFDGMPMRGIPRADPVVEAELMRHLAARQIPLVEHVRTREPVLRVLYGGAAVLLVAAAWAVRRDGRISDVWLIVGLLVAGSLLCAGLDRLRGFQVMTRVRPMTISAPDAAAQEAATVTPNPTAGGAGPGDWASRAKTWE